MTSTIKEDMPLLASREGVWDGIYRHLDADCKLLDEHRSRLFIRFKPDAEFPYHQTNYYTWEDGRTEVHDMPCRYVNGSREVVFDSPRIKGMVRELSDDPKRRSTFLYWERPELPEVYFYEMINVTDCGRFRSRVWQWIREGEGLIRRTLIQEKKISEDWRALEPGA